MALVLLRCSIAAFPFVITAQRVLLLQHPMLLLVVVAIAVMLCIGFATEVGGMAALIVQVVILLRVHPMQTGLSIIATALCLSSTLLGAGHYSLDGLLYGRKRVHLPARASRTHKLH